MSLSTRTKTVGIVSTIVFLVSGSTLAFLVYRIEHDAGELQQKAAALALREAQEKERLDTVRLLEDTLDERTELKSYILTEEGIINFLTDLEATAENQQLDFITQSITPLDTPDPLFDQVSINLAFTGDQEDVSFLLKLLETLPYLSSLESVAVRQGAGEGRWSANVTLLMTIQTP